MKKIQNRNVILLLLSLVYAFNFVDRQILGILAPFIQKDLGLTDGQIGLLAGFFFALFYTVVGLPVAWLADRSNRVTIVSVALGLWSGFTALSGMVGNYTQLALARMGVGIGEAGGSPPSHSIISDLYNKEERGRALGIYSLGIPLGIMAAFFISAMLLGKESFNWRLVFLVLGIPGVLLAIVVKLWMPEPVRGNLDAKKIESNKPASLWTALRTLAKFPSYWAMCFGISLASFAAYSTAAFQMLYLLREFPDASVPKLLVILGVLHGITYAGGTYVGGMFADRWGKSTPAGYAYTAMVGVMIATPFLLGIFWAPNMAVTLVCIGFYLFFIGFYLGPSFSVAQTLAPASMRSMSTAIFFFILNLFALGGGPTFVGFLSEYLGQIHGATEGLRLALSSLCVVTILATGSFWIAGRYLPDDWRRANSPDA